MDCRLNEIDVRIEMELIELHALCFKENYIRTVVFFNEITSSLITYMHIVCSSDRIINL